MPQMDSNYHQFKTETQNRRNAKFLQTTSLNNKGSKILIKSTKIDAVTDDATSTVQRFEIQNKYTK